MDFYARRSAERDMLLAYLGEEHDLRLLTEMKGNIGDHLIWAGTRDLLSAGAVSYTPMPLSELGGAARPGSTLLIPGSGAFHRHWHEWLPEAVRTASRVFHKVIILPSSFDPDVPVVARCLARPNVHAFAREERSYRSIEAFGRATLSFDCAIYFHEFKDGAATAAQRIDDGVILLALREDKESLLPLQGARPDPLLNRDISLTCGGLDEWLAAIAQAGSVITDRLHVAVASVLLGKQLIYIDPCDAKISKYWAYTFGDAFGHLVKQRSLSWLVAHEYVVAGPERPGRPADPDRSRRQGRDDPLAGHEARPSDALPERRSKESRPPVRPIGGPAMKICGIACVKDSRELLQATMTHLVLNGISDFYLYDHGSDPALAGALADAFRAGGVRVRVLRKETPRYFQRAMVGALTELARMDGFETALAFDADEFWCSTVPGRTLVEQISIEMTAGLDALRVPVVNYVQHRGVSAFTVDSLKTCRYAVEPCADPARPARERVDAGAPFVAMPFPAKVIARLACEIRFTEGNHDITRSQDECAQAEARGIVVRHLSLSARGDLAVKREQGRRRIAAGFDPEIGWQLQRLAFRSNEELDAYWDNNSWHLADDGRVLVGDYDRLIEDDALVGIGRDLAPAIDRLGASPMVGADGATAVGADGTSVVVAIDAPRLERLLESLVDDFGTADMRLSEREEEMATLRQEVATLRHELERRSASLAQIQATLEAERAEARSVLDEIEKSVSWRVTAPLRAIKRGRHG